MGFYRFVQGHMGFQGLAQLERYVGGQMENSMDNCIQ